MLDEKVRLIESIGKLLKDISELEREKKGDRVCHELSSIKPTVIDRDEEKKSLDALARLLNNKDETCIALCYVKDKLLIAGNDEKIKEYTKKHLESLKRYVQSPFKQQYENLLIPSIVEFLRRVEFALSRQSDSGAKRLNRFLKQVVEDEDKEFSKLI